MYVCVYLCRTEVDTSCLNSSLYLLRQGLSIENEIENFKWLEHMLGSVVSESFSMKVYTMKVQSSLLTINVKAGYLAFACQLA